MLYVNINTSCLRGNVIYVDLLCIFGFLWTFWAFFGLIWTFLGFLGIFWHVWAFLGISFKIFDHLFQDYNASKVISEVNTSFVCNRMFLGGNVNTRQMSKPDMGSIYNPKRFESALTVLTYVFTWFSRLALLLDKTRQTDRQTSKFIIYLYICITLVWF